MIDPSTVNAASIIVDTWLANLLQGLILLIASGTGIGIMFVFKSLGGINVHLAKLNGRTKAMEDWQTRHEESDIESMKQLHADIQRIDSHIMDDLIDRARAADSPTA